MGHGFTPPRDRGSRAAARTGDTEKVTDGDSSSLGNPATTNYYYYNGDLEPHVGGGGEGRISTKRGGDRHRKGSRQGGGKGFPSIGVPGQILPPVEGDSGIGVGGRVRGSRRGSGRDQAGWINSRSSHGTLQELLRTTH